MITFVPHWLTLCHPYSSSICPALGRSTASPREHNKHQEIYKSILSCHHHHHSSSDFKYRSWKRSMICLNTYLYTRYTVEYHMARSHNWPRSVVVSVSLKKSEEKSGEDEMSGEWLKRFIRKSQPQASGPLVLIVKSVIGSL